jgi:alpha-L-fucosidase
MAVRTKVLSQLFLIGVVCAATGAWAGSDQLPPETEQQRDARMGWWRQARFGMFIHWGLYAIPAGEWKGQKIPGLGEWIMTDAAIPVAEYQKLQQQFNPVKFDAKRWAAMARSAGMKYVVLTTKHIDGFCMFDSKLTDYDMMGTPFKRDVMKELSEAVRGEGMKMCAYYSISDFHYPDYCPLGPGSSWPRVAQVSKQPDFKRYQEYLGGQLRELLTQYGPLGVLWFDACYDQSPEDIHAIDLVKMMRAIQPDLIVNNRLGCPLDYDTPEQFIPATGIPGRDWETCMTINDTWGFKRDDLKWKSSEMLLRNLIDIVSKGGNYLLNVGPTAEGEIPADIVKRLEDIGGWMAVNGEAIYGTTASPFHRLNWGRCTQKPGTLYLHVFDWPKGELEVPGLKSKVEQAYLLADQKRLPLVLSQMKDNVIIRLPAQAPDGIASVVVLSIAGSADVAPYAVVPAADGSITLPAVDATVHGKTARYDSERGQDNIGYWTDASDWVSWDCIIKKPGTYTVEIVFACVDGNAGSEYLVEVAGKKLAGKVEGTGGWNKFVTKPLGRVSLDAAGRQTLAVRASTMPNGAVMNLKAIVLKPVP